jgi:hypothetical protein
MALSSLWTGRSATPAWRIDERGDEVLVDVLEAPPPPPEPEPAPYVPTKYQASPVELSAYSADQLREYGEVAEAVGVLPDALIVERFKAFLIENTITVFSLKTVTAFMDQKSKDEGRGWGWNWRALRPKDVIQGHFGRAAQRFDDLRGGLVIWNDGNAMQQARRDPVIASDHWAPENGVYRDVVPLHALKKVALIEKGFPHNVAFMVSDYAPAPAFRVDPFLLAVVPNAGLHGGAGRFVIDVWDEPGFGIDQMLQTDAA